MPCARLLEFLQSAPRETVGGMGVGAGVTGGSMNGRSVATRRSSIQKLVFQHGKGPRHCSGTASTNSHCQRGSAPRAESPVCCVGRHRRPHLALPQGRFGGPVKIDRVAACHSVRWHWHAAVASGSISGTSAGDTVAVTSLQYPDHDSVATETYLQMSLEEEHARLYPLPFIVHRGIFGIEVCADNCRAVTCINGYESESVRLICLVCMY